MKANTKFNRMLALLLTLVMLLGLFPIATVLAEDVSYDAPYGIVLGDVGLNNTNGFYLVNGAAATSGTLGEGGCTAHYDRAAGILHLNNYTGTTISVVNTSGNTKLTIDLTGTNTVEWINGNDNLGTTFEITSAVGGTLNVSKTGDGDLAGIDAGSSAASSKGKVILSGKAAVNVTLTHLTKASGNYATGIFAREGIEIKDDASFSAVLNAKTVSSNRVFGLDVKNSTRYDIVINTTGTVDIDCSGDTSPYTYPIHNNTGGGKVDLQNVGTMTLKYRQYSLNKESYPEITYAAALERTSTTTDTVPAITTVTYAPASDTPTTKTDPVITANPTASPITYGQTLADSTLSGGEVSVEGTFAWKNHAAAPQVSDSNSTEYEVIFTPTDTDHYNTVTRKVKLKVNPKGIAANVADIPDQPYTGRQIKPTVTVTDATGDVTLTEGTDYTVTYGTNTAVGPASVHIKAVADGNYKFTNASSTTGEVTKNFTIKKGDLNATILGGSDKTYTGNPVLDSSVLVRDAITSAELGSDKRTVSYTYYICLDAPGDISTETTAANSGAEGNGKAPKYAGNYVVEATVTAENYNTAIARKAFTIKKKDSRVTNVQKVSPETIYNTTHLFNIRLAGNCTPSEGTLELVSGQTLVVGTQEYDWKFTPTDARNYKTATGKIQLTVVQEEIFPTEYTITVTDGKATVGAGVPISKAAEGTTITLTADAAPAGKVFDKWVVEGGSITLADASSSTTTFTMPAGAVSVKATYKDAPVATYNLTTQVNGGNGTISTSKTGLTAGSTETVVFTPDSGYEIDIVTVNGVTTPILSNVLDVTMDADKTVIVTYKAIGSSEHSHSYGSEWKNDADKHWQECSCGDKADTAAHSFKWVVDKEATATQKGSKHEECKVCGYKKAAVEIPATGTPTKPTDPTNPEKPTKPEDPKSPQTGDNSMMGLWIALLFVSGGVLAGTTIYSRKRKTEE